MSAPASARKRRPRVQLDDPATVAVLVGLAVLAVLLLALPSNMDEFLPYQVDNCRRAAQRVNQWSVACDDFPIRLGSLAFERSYSIVGVSSSLLIRPVAAVSRTVLTHRLVGAVVLAFVGLGIARSLRLPAWTSTVAFAVFPLAFAVVRDTGPVRLTMMAVAWAPVLLRTALLGRSRPWRSLAAVTLVAAFVIAAEDKPFAMFVIPGAVLWMGVALVHTGEAAVLRERLAAASAILATMASAPMLLLATLRVPEDGGSVSYLSTLIEGRDDLGRAPGDVLLAPTYALAWPSSMHRLLDVLDGPMAGAGNLATLLLALSAVGALTTYLVAALIVRRAGGPTPRRVAWMLVGVAAVLAASAHAARGWAIHHYAYALIPLTALLMAAVVAIRRTAGSRLSLLLSAALIVASAPALAAPAVLPVRSESAREIEPLVRAVQDAADERGALINTYSWGAYYLARWLRPDGPPVVWADEEEDIVELYALAADEAAPIIHVCLRCRALDVRLTYRSAPSVTPLFTAGAWRAYLVTTSPVA